ncbi:MAG: FkbM family methyltransferase [Kiritimatiellae bacterium]|nr:FkbM family methyltransferase [Kiritimatiellia bacterium]
MNLRDNVDDITRSRHDLEHREGKILSVPDALPRGAVVWDIGANVGLFSVKAAVTGHPVVAFECAEGACRLLRKTVRRANLPVTVVERAFSVEPIRYFPPKSSNPKNSVRFAPDGPAVSMTFAEAMRAYPEPTLVKMDIEGGEMAFFRADAFKKWVLERRVFWLVEVHHAVLGAWPEWKDVPHSPLDADHVLYAADGKVLEDFMRRLPTSE